MSIYEDEGFANRNEYLIYLAEDYGLEKEDVFLMAQVLGPSEDFDGLISTLEDMQDMKAHEEDLLADQRRERQEKQTQQKAGDKKQSPRKNGYNHDR